MRLTSSAGYLRDVFEPTQFKQSLRKVARRVKELRKQLGFDAIAFRGNSGAAFAYPLSALLGIPIICVRKEDGGSHHGQPVEGPIYYSKVDVNAYLILDDLIASGGTVKAIIQGIGAAEWVDEKGRRCAPPRCVGVLLWQSVESYDVAYDTEKVGVPVCAMRGEPGVVQAPTVCAMSGEPGVVQAPTVTRYLAMESPLIIGESLIQAAQKLWEPTDWPAIEAALNYSRNLSA